MLELGQKAPDFKLLDQNDNQHLRLNQRGTGLWFKVKRF
jgi:peroxiredoxin